MLSSLDGLDLANTIRLLVKSGDSKIIVVEGESDYNALAELFDQPRVELLSGYGKPSLLEAAISVVDETLDTVRFLVDADFDRLVFDELPYPVNVSATTYYDIFIDVVCAAPELLKRIARLNWATNPGAASVESLIALSWTLAIEVGALRYASEREGWYLNTSKLPIHSFIPDPIDVAIDQAGIASVAIQRTKACSISQAEVLAQRSRWADSITDRSLLANSHDLLSALCQVGRKHAGASSSTGYETQLVLVACPEMHRVPVIAELQTWARAS
jgi:hypothetical protein